MHVAVPGLPVVTAVVPQPVFELHATVPLTSWACPATNPRPRTAPLRPFTSPYCPLIVAVNVTGCPYVDGFVPEVTVVVDVADVMIKLPV